MDYLEILKQEFELQKDNYDFFSKKAKEKAGHIH